MYNEPLNWFVPLRVTVFTLAPTKLPSLTSYGATLTWTCSIASSEIGATPVRSPGPPVAVSRPNEPLKYDPSIVMLFPRLSCPTNVPLPPYWGLNRVISVMRPDTVGSVAKSSRIIAVAAPVRLVLNTGSDVAVTVTSSATAAAFSLTRCRSPRPG